MSVTKTKCLIAMVKVSKNENFKNFERLYKIWNKIISFDMRKKRQIEDKSWQNQKKR